jgi:hypothetical protein
MTAMSPKEWRARWEAQIALLEHQWQVTDDMMFAYMAYMHWHTQNGPDLLPRPEWCAAVIDRAVARVASWR